MIRMMRFYYWFTGLFQKRICYLQPSEYLMVEFSFVLEPVYPYAVIKKEDLERNNG